MRRRVKREACGECGKNIRKRDKEQKEDGKKNAGTQSKGQFELKLYVAGQTPKSMRAFANLKKLCEEHLEGKYHIDVIDLLKNPTLAKEDAILAIPTLIRKLPLPIRKIIGDLSDTEQVLVGLQLRPASPTKGEPK